MNNSGEPQSRGSKYSYWHLVRTGVWRRGTKQELSPGGSPPLGSVLDQQEGPGEMPHSLSLLPACTFGHFLPLPTASRVTFKILGDSVPRSQF